MAVGRRDCDCIEDTSRKETLSLYTFRFLFLDRFRFRRQRLVQQIPRLRLDLVFYYTLINFLQRACTRWTVTTTNSTECSPRLRLASWAPPFAPSRWRTSRKRSPENSKNRRPPVRLGCPCCRIKCRSLDPGSVSMIPRPYLVGNLCYSMSEISTEIFAYSVES